MIRELQVHERSYCRCKKCSVPCRSQPGALAPCDIDHIAEFFGVEPTTEFLVQNFSASMIGESIAIRPKMKDSGQCVFLGDAGQCTIHPVAPFECQMYSGCQPVPGPSEHLEHVNKTNIDNQHLWLAIKQHEERAASAT